MAGDKIMDNKPISTNCAEEEHLKRIPPFVLTAVNRLLAEKFNDSSITIRQDVVIELATEIAAENSIAVTRDEFFNNHWLDFEKIYRKEGWEVVYNKPFYYETFSAFWVFKKKR
jgi:hypothetical protein